MHRLVRPFLAWLLHLGLFGPLFLGVADSSFLFLPFGNDLLVVILVARNHSRLPIYALTASIGSLIGVLLLDVICRKGGEEGLKKLLKPARFEYFKRRIISKAGIAITAACLAPPPFPFTVVIAGVSAFAYPRPRLLTLVFTGRLMRFGIVGWLAVRFGRHILRIADAPATESVMFGFIVICIVGSAYQVLQWTRHSRHLVRQHV